MNAVTQTRPERIAESMQQLGEVTAVWQIMPDALMVVGWRNGMPAPNGFVSIPSAAGSRGRYHLAAWSQPQDGPNVFQFIAAIQLPPEQAVCGDETVLMTGQGERASVLARLPHTFHDAASFGTELALLAVSSVIPVTRFLLQTFSPAASSGNAEIRTMLHTFLMRASTPEGCIEMIGVIDGACALLQGWGGPMIACDLVLVSTGIEISEGKIALFARPDMRGNATGQSFILPEAATRAARQLEAVVLLDRRGLRWRPVLPERKILTGADATGHLRATLPSLQCDAETKTLIQAHLRPRFDGRFTLYDNGHPVRVAVDLAATREGAGTYLTGWLFDPAGVVSSVELRNMQGEATCIDTTWTRLARPDVTEAFKSDPALPAPLPGQNRHGFAVHVARVGPANRMSASGMPANGMLYLDVTFRDGACGFVPLTVEADGNVALRTRLLASVDLNKSSGSEIIEHHLAPFLLDWTSGPPVAPSIHRGWTTVIVVPLHEPTLPRALLSQFLRDGLGSSEGMLFVCGDGWTDAGLEALASLAVFYGVAHAILRDCADVSPAAALLAAATVTDTQRLLLLGPGTIGRTPGWRQELYAALDDADSATCISPTVVYEDNAVRFGGSDAVERLDAAPYARIKRRLAGMPVSLIRATEIKSSATVSVACCLVRRDVLQKQAAVAMATSSSAQEVALSMLMKQSGVALAWLPLPQVYAADLSTADMNENAVRVAHLAEGWCLRARLES